MSKTYEWEDLKWNQVTPSISYARMNLLPAEKLRVEEGWEITGPIRVSFRWNKAENHTRIRYKALHVSKLNLDDPTEYPCAACGASRGTPCVGDDARCTFRVFLTTGGKL